MNRERGRVALSVAVITAVALTAGVLAGGASPRSVRHAVPLKAVKADVSTDAKARSYLRRLGIDARGVVIQRGLRNYAGPRCPARGWTCTRATRVLQIAQAGGVNKYTCSAATCFASQPSATTNDARCTQRSSGPAQSCEIHQTNAAAENRAFIDQQLQDRSPACTHSDTQTAIVDQQNGTGRNSSDIHQQLQQQLKSTLCATQKQDVESSATVTQESTTGDNTSDIHQSIDQNADANGGTSGSITQLQDTDSGPNGSYSVTQTSTSGSNSSNVEASFAATAHANTKTGAIVQQQGNFAAGLEGDVFQSSAGVSMSHNHLRKNWDLDGHTQGNLTQASQSQQDPLRCCTTQTGNTNDRMTIDEDSSVHGNGTGDQTVGIYGTCESDGMCHVTQRGRTNDAHADNRCDSPSCDIAVECFASEGPEECFAEDFSETTTGDLRVAPAPR